MDRRNFLTKILSLGALTAVSALTASTAWAHRGRTRYIRSLPAKITESGRYTLAQDLKVSLSSGAAIDIAADEVTLDLNGHKITNLLDRKAIGIRVRGYSRILVRDGTIFNFFVGCSLGYNLCPRDWLTEVSAHDLTVSRVGACGIAADGGTVTISRCTVSDFGSPGFKDGSIGISAVSTRSIVRGNRVYGNCALTPGATREGIFVPQLLDGTNETRGDVIRGNIVSGCDIGIGGYFSDPDYRRIIRQNNLDQTKIKIA